MKAKVKKSESKILLSIGMIVKNEERHLENCMRAMLPLRQRIPSELIIVDTGSTDRTIEIAKKYADKFYTFKWCNDFAKARNYGLDRAEGKWFMFVDADEYFDEDISEIVDFFKYPELYEKYNSASYIIRSYSDDTNKYYSDFLGSRMVKRMPDVRFHDAIHEWLPMKTPHGYFGTIAHHYGYVYKNEKEKNNKIERNMEPLLEEYKKNPENSRILCLLYGSCKQEDRKKYLYKWLEVCRKGKGYFYRNHCYKEGIAFHAYYEEYDKSIELYNEYMEEKSVENSICTVQVYAMMALIYYNQDKFKEAYEFYEKYFKIYERYCNNELDINELRGSEVKGINPCGYQEYSLNAAHCLFKLGRDDEALKILNKFDMKNMDFCRFAKYSSIIISLADDTSKYKYIADFYGKVIETGDIDRIIMTNKQMEDVYYNNPENRIEFANAISNIDANDSFVLTMKIISEAEKNIDGIGEKVQQLVDSVENWDGGYSEIIYMAVKYKADISKAILLMTHEQIKNYFFVISSRHKDYAEIVLEYADIEEFTSSIKEFFWIVSALEMAVLSSKELDDLQKHNLYYTFITAISDYVLNIYNPELLNENDVEVMPSLHRFGYYMGCAMISKSNNDKIGYIRNIKNALKNSESMKDVVSFLLEEFEHELK
jgi:glycosyltransferase involved in cell wall biosynthesis